MCAIIAELHTSTEAQAFRPGLSPTHLPSYPRGRKTRSLGVSTKVNAKISYKPLRRFDRQREFIRSFEDVAKKVNMSPKTAMKYFEREMLTEEVLKSLQEAHNREDLLLGTPAEIVEWDNRRWCTDETLTSGSSTR